MNLGPRLTLEMEDEQPDATLVIANFFVLADDRPPFSGDTVSDSEVFGRGYAAKDIEFSQSRTVLTALTPLIHDVQP